jgi:phage I-like protein
MTTTEERRPGIADAAVENGVAVWSARTVPELTDAVRWLAGKLSEVEAPVPPDLSGYVPLADFQALQAQVTALEATTGTMQAQVTQIDTDLDTVSADLDALDARVVVLETPPAP